MKKTIVLSIILALSPTLALAKMYVSDHLVITLRTGPGTQFQIIKSLPSGTALELLEEAENGYVQVNTESGKTGWVMGRFLTEEKIAKDKLEMAEKHLSTMQKKSSSLRIKLKAANAEITDLRKDGENLNSENTLIGQELTELKKISARPIELSKNNKALTTRVNILEGELNLARTRIDSLEDTSHREWFLVGAGVLFGGILLGLLLPKLKRSRNMWGDLR
ncbi:MAG: TIGR04211 family SH3 domain-containing protein [Gammaproteobacteria bacterium]|nr:TIGR04211 family SH3 domain-containing protein [Gammaproteobacteria bacterium]